MGGVRRFYHYQSRLLQGGFSSLFGPKLQEIYLKISFTLANASTSHNSSQLPDVLGTVARAKGSKDAVTAANEISQIGHFTSDSDAARHHEKGIIAYAQNSVQFDMEFLENIRDECCAGMDAFDTIMEMDAESDIQRLAVLSTFLMQIMERMANRLQNFYEKLARYSVFRPEMENNPARARWNILKRKIRDGTFFLLTRNVVMSTLSHSNHSMAQNGVDFDHVIAQIQNTLDNTPIQPSRVMGLNEQHSARAENNPNNVTAYERHQAGSAVKSIEAFMNNNKRAIRRLSKLPQAINLEQLMQTYGSTPTHPGNLPTPPSSRSSSRSRLASVRIPTNGHTTMPRRHTTTSESSMSPSSTPGHISPAVAMAAMMTKLNTRPRSGTVGIPSPPQSAKEDRIRSMHSFSGARTSAMGGRDGMDAHLRAQSTTSSLRAFRLQASAMAGGLTRRGDA